GNSDRCSVERESGNSKGGKQSFRGGKDGDAVAGFDFSGAVGGGLDSGDQGDAFRGQLAVATEVVGAEGSGAGYGYVQRSAGVQTGARCRGRCARGLGHLSLGSLAFDDIEATAVEVEELVDLFFGFG